MTKSPGMNDGWGYYNSDKKTAFYRHGNHRDDCGVTAYFIFKLLQNHPLVIAFIYAFTVMIVLTFAIEIGQGFYGTGNMEMEDVVAGMGGFLFFLRDIRTGAGDFLADFQPSPRKRSKKRKK